MKFFKSRLFAALSLAASIGLAALGNPAGGLVVFLCTSMLALGASQAFEYRLGVQTFTSSELFLQYMQKNYGSANFSQWQSIRKQFYSYVAYPTAGISSLNFFTYAQGSAATGTNAQYTNMPKAGSFGQQFLLLKSIQTAYFIAGIKDLFADAPSTVTAVDTANPAADFTAGLFQAGHMLVTIGAKPYIEVPKPFLYAPPADGQTMLASAVGFTSSLSTGAPNTLLTAQSGCAYADLNRDQQSRYIVDPNILFEAEQQFSVTVDWQSGLIPLISTGIFTSNTTLYLGVIFDGILFRPVQ